MAFDSSGENDPNPYGNYYFALEINSSEVGHFIECSGLKSSTEVYEISEGGLNGATHKRPKKYKWENIVLRYATSSNTTLMEWFDKYLRDDYAQRTNYSGSITLKNNHGDTVRKWQFTNAWPVSWEGPQLSAEGSALAIESLEIAHDGLKISNS